MRIKRNRFILVASLAFVACVGVLAVLAVRAWDKICGNYRIAFYARAVDENGAALANASVDIQVRYSDRPVLPGAYGRTERIRIVRVMTDANGQFELTGTSGYSFSIVKFLKAGIQWSVQPPYRRQVPVGFSYGERNSRASIPDVPARRLTYPLSPD